MSVDFVEGFEYDNGYLSPYLVTHPASLEAILDDPYILLCSEKITKVQQLMPLLDKVMRAPRPLVVIAETVEGVGAEHAGAQPRQRRSSSASRPGRPGFGDRRLRKLEDIATITGGAGLQQALRLQPRDDDRSSSSAGPGRSGSPPTAPPSSAAPGRPEQVEFRLAQLRAELERATFGIDEDVLTERIGSLSGKVAVIRVGAPTNAELAELQHRVEDALSATRAAMAEGIVAGGGVALLHAAPALDDARRQGRLRDRGGDRAPRADRADVPHRHQRRLPRPRGGRPRSRSMGVDEGFDALEGRYGNMIEMGIIDPLRVCRSALQNGASVAGLLLTTNTLIAEEQTPWGGSRALMTEFGAARRGPAPAVAGLQHAAVAGPRPVGRVSGADATDGDRPPAPPAGRTPARVAGARRRSRDLCRDVRGPADGAAVLRAAGGRARRAPASRRATDPVRRGGLDHGAAVLRPVLRPGRRRRRAASAAPEDDVAATQPGAEVLEWHRVLLRLRDHYADPAVNPRERFSVGVAQDADGAAAGVAITSVRQPLVDDLTVRQTGRDRLRPQRRWSTRGSTGAGSACLRGAEGACHQRSLDQLATRWTSRWSDARRRE